MYGSVSGGNRGENAKEVHKKENMVKSVLGEIFCRSLAELTKINPTKMPLSQQLQKKTFKKIMKTNS